MSTSSSSSHQSDPRISQPDFQGAWHAQTIATLTYGRATRSWSSNSGLVASGFVNPTNSACLVTWVVAVNKKVSNGAIAGTIPKLQDATLQVTNVCQLSTKSGQSGPHASASAARRQLNNNSIGVLVHVQPRGLNLEHLILPISKPTGNDQNYYINNHTYFLIIL